MTGTRERATEVVSRVADQLADPARVAQLTAAPDNLDYYDGAAPTSPWQPVTLSAGHPGIALLFAELSRTDPAYRSLAHAHLEAGTRHLSSRHFGLYQGLAGVGLAAATAARHDGDYAGLLQQVDDQVQREARGLVGIEHQRMDAGMAGTPIHAYDLISGLAGLAAYLLGRPDTETTVKEVLACLVRLTEPVRVQGRPVPGWWTPGSPMLDPAAAVGRYADGHFNLGLAHGIPGPLALLSLARLAGVSVPGQDDAIRRVVAWIFEHRLIGAHGGYWPVDVSLQEQLREVPAEAVGDRLAWCYGTPGVARSLQLAARAVGEPTWEKEAVDAARAALADERFWSWNTSLCHGLGGLLQVAWLMARDTGDAVLAHSAERLTEALIDRYDETAAFGYQYTAFHTKLAPNRPGFLEGAAGVVLALHAYVVNSPSQPGWHAAMLLDGGNS